MMKQNASNRLIISGLVNVLFLNPFKGPQNIALKQGQSVSYSMIEAALIPFVAFIGSALTQTLNPITQTLNDLTRDKPVLQNGSDVKMLATALSETPLFNKSACAITSLSRVRESSPKPLKCTAR